MFFKFFHIFATNYHLHHEKKNIDMEPAAMDGTDR